MLDQFIQQLDIEQLLTTAVERLPGVAAAIVIFLVFWAGYRLLRLPARATLLGAGLAEPLVEMLVDNVFKYSALIFGIVMAADQIGINVAAALGAIGVAGIAVGFAAQDTLSNIIAGFLIFIDKPFLVGDWVDVAGEKGEVAEITMRTTRIKTKNNTWIIIPNKKIIDEVLINHSKRGATRIDVPLGIAYKEYIPKAREVLLEALADVPHLLDDPPPDVVVTGLGASSVDLEVRAWIDQASNEPSISAAIIESSKLALDAAGIEIPFPHLQLFVDDVKAPVWEGLTALNRQPRGGVRPS